MDEQPTYSSAALGYRGWVVKGGLLASTWRGHVWQPGPNLAFCDLGRGHQCPDMDCECGFYALHDLGPALMRGHIQGAVAGRGQLAVQGIGFRAEEIAILGLTTSRAAYRELGRAVALRYGVPFFDDPNDLREYAERHAGTVPVAERPAIDNFPNPGNQKAEALTLGLAAAGVAGVGYLIKRLIDENNKTARQAQQRRQQPPSSPSSGPMI